MVSIPYDQIEVGQKASLERKLTLQDLQFRSDGDGGRLDPAQVTSDLYHRIITQGMWATGLISVAIAARLPGPGSRLLHNDLDYHAQLRLGDSVRIDLEVLEKRSERRVLLDCRCEDSDGRLIVSGRALVEAPEHAITEPDDLLAQSGGGLRRQLHRLLGLARGLPPLRMAVVHPVDAHSLGGALEAHRRGLIEPVLVGPEQRIRDAAARSEHALDGIEIISTEHSHAAAARAVELARNRDVAALMKGALHTDEFMGAIVDRKGGLRTERRMSHVWVMDVPTYPRPLLITDSALNIRPDLTAKADIARNAIDLARAMGIEQPRVAVLSATEEVNPQIQSTLDAAALCKMVDRGQIKGGLLDGPLAFDNAISEVAARTKGIRSTVAGRPDILLAPDLESANMLGKQLHYLADAEAAGIVVGARVPIVLTSRADDTLSRVAACAVALLMAQGAK
nr:bifunctional enoyl-CoA hydratase/phosphate acetyltransferase [Natronocella acetinitrilica]